MTSTTRHNPTAIAPPLGAYSNGVSAPAGGRWLYVAGQVGVAPDGSLPSSIAAQAEQAWCNVEAVLSDAGMGIDDVVRFTHYLVDADDVAAYGAVRAAHLGAARPASTLLIVAALARPEWRVEIDAVAWRA
jgi:enamine deaminase RidA (YjgF/YER057c/UK114 family)